MAPYEPKLYLHHDIEIVGIQPFVMMRSIATAYCFDVESNPGGVIMNWISRRISRCASFGLIALLMASVVPTARANDYPKR